MICGMFFGVPRYFDVKEHPHTSSVYINFIPLKEVIK